MEISRRRRERREKGCKKWERGKELLPKGGKFLKRLWEAIKKVKKSR